MMRRTIPLACTMVLIAACAPIRAVTGYFRYDNPPQLAGTWVDSARATPTDTVAWVLGARGLDQTLTIRRGVGPDGAPTRTEQLDGYGYWYTRDVGAAADAGHICFRSRARGRDACFPFTLTRLPADAAGRARRRLAIIGYAGRRDTRDRILIERDAQP